MNNTVSNRTRNLPCYNNKCAAVFQYTKITGCPFSDMCPEFMAVGFGSAKKKTNFVHIKEMSVDEFIDLVSVQACPPGSCNCETYEDGTHKTCQSCWKDWLNSEYHN